MAVRMNNSCKNHVRGRAVPQLACREFAERALLESKRAVAKLDTGSWNVGSVITDKKDRQAILVLHLSV